MSAGACPPRARLPPSGPAHTLPPCKHPSCALSCLPQIADELIEEAKSMLSTYDPAKAAPLYALAEYIRSRKN